MMMFKCYEFVVCYCRDWRGLASLINISSEAAASIRCNDREDRTDKVLNIWISRNDGTATLGRLMDFLQILDRFDVSDDILELARDNKLIGRYHIKRDSVHFFMCIVQYHQKVMILLPKFKKNNK